jgi:hypothetical protein
MGGGIKSECLAGSPRNRQQEWADMIDAWVEGQKHMPVLMPPAMAVGPLEPAVGLDR